MFFTKTSMFFLVIGITLNLNSVLANPVQFSQEVKSVNEKGEANLCPSPTQIAPCICEISEEESNGNGDCGKGLCLSCSGPSITQADVNRAFFQVRQVNGLNSDDYLNISSFKMGSTALSQFNLEPLIRTNFSTQYGIKILFNSNLTSITGPPLDDSTRNSINVRLLYLRYNGLTDEGLGDSLHYFSSSLTWLDLYDNSLEVPTTHLIDDGSGDSEFLPGLAKLSNLEILYLRNNRLTRLGGGQFKRNGRLNEIKVRGNNLKEIGEDAFLIDGGNGTGNNYLIVIMDGNSLTDASFHVNSGLATRGRKLEWHLQDNFIQTLPQNIFEPILDAHPETSIRLEGNPLFCDGKLTWLKNRREEMEPRVLKAMCRNDPGQSVFTSNLIET